MPSSEKDLNDLLASATTVEEARAARALIEEYARSDSVQSRYMVPTLRDVAAFFGVQEQTVRQWNMRPGGIPGTAGAWPLDDIARWLTRWREAPDRTSEPKPMELVKQRLAELDLEEREKRLVDVSEISIWIGRMAAIIRDGITQLEQRHGAEAANVMRTPLERLVREAEAHATE